MGNLTSRIAPAARHPWEDDADDLTRHNAVNRVVQERDKPVVKPALPIDRPSPTIKASPTKVRKVAISIRLDPDIVEFFERTGPGWQTRMNEALRKAIE